MGKFKDTENVFGSQFENQADDYANFEQTEFVGLIDIFKNLNGLFQPPENLSEQRLDHAADIAGC